MAPGTGKGANYARSLDLVRRAGLWDSKSPVTAKGQLTASGSESGALTWEELVRKFGKHNPERQAAAEAALADQTIHSLLERAAYQHEFDGDTVHLHDDPERGRVLLPPLVLDGDRKTAEWSLGKVENVAQGGKGTGTDQDRNSATVVLAFAQYALGDFGRCLDTLDQANTNVPEAKVGEGGGLASFGLEQYDLALFVMASALRGLANERSGSVADALENYKATVKVYDACLALLGGRDDRNEEMHAWAEEAMYRLALLSRTHQDEATSLEAHRVYQFHSRYWPTSFRLAKRGALVSSYLQLLYLCARHRTYRPIQSSRPSLDDAEKQPASGGAHKSFVAQQAELLPGQAWRSEVLSVQRSYESILRRTTKFPKAGSINAPVLEFCDMAVEGWTLGGRQPDEAEEVVEMLYRATTLTFQSQRILRHLIELLQAKGAYAEAKEALLLYVQLFTRAKETGASDDKKKGSGGGGDDEGADEGDEDYDSDEQFIATLLLGVRLLVKHLDDADLAAKMAERAAKTVKGDEDRFGAKMRSRVERMLGIAIGAQAQKADRETRAELQTRYLSHLTRACKLDESSFESLYHLAFAQAELRQVGLALTTARRACEARPQSKEAWHLVALLVSAQRDLRLALDVIDSGLSETPNATSVSAALGQVNGGGLANGGLAPPSAPGMQRGGSAASSDGEFQDAREGQTPAPFDSDDKQLRARPGGTMGRLQEKMAGLSTADAGFGSTAAAAELDARRAAGGRLEFDQSEADELEATVQLRMTRNVVVESIEGAEAALQDQQTLFMFFSQIAPLIKNRAPKKDYSQAQWTEAPLAAAPPIEQAVPNSRQPLLKSLNRRSITPATGGQASRKVSGAASIRSGVVGVGGGRGVTPLDNEEDPEEVQAQQRALRARSDALLQTLWLMSAATFRRWGKTQECKAAIQEAETLNGDHPEVWVQLGLYSLSTGDPITAVSAFTKSLAFSQDYIPAVVHLAKLFVAQGSAELAEGLLDVLTQTTGWDVPEAWLLLGKVCEQTRRAARARECYLYALQLEETKPIRALDLSVPRVL